MPRAELQPPSLGSQPAAWWSLSEQGPNPRSIPALGTPSTRVYLRRKYFLLHPHPSPLGAAGAPSSRGGNEQQGGRTDGHGDVTHTAPSPPRAAGAGRGLQHSLALPGPTITACQPQQAPECLRSKETRGSSQRILPGQETERDRHGQRAHSKNEHQTPQNSLLLGNGATKVGVTPRAQPCAGERLRQHREQIESEDRSKLPPDCYK